MTISCQENRLTYRQQQAGIREGSESEGRESDKSDHGFEHAASQALDALRKKIKDAQSELDSHLSSLDTDQRVNQYHASLDERIQLNRLLNQIERMRSEDHGSNRLRTFTTTIDDAIAALREHVRLNPSQKDPRQVAMALYPFRNIRMDEDGISAVYEGVPLHLECDDRFHIVALTCVLEGKSVEVRFKNLVDAKNFSKMFSWLKQTMQQRMSDPTTAARLPDPLAITIMENGLVAVSLRPASIGLRTKAGEKLTVLDVMNEERTKKGLHAMTDEEYLECLTDTLDTVQKKDAFIRQSFQFVYDSDDPADPRKQGTEERHGEYWQSPKDTIARTVRNKMLGDCDDAAGLFNEINRRQGIASFVIMFDSHAESVWIDGPDHGVYTAYSAGVGGIRQRTGVSKEDAYKKLAMLFSKSSTGSVSADPQNITVMYNGEGMTNKTYKGATVDIFTRLRENLVQLVDFYKKEVRMNYRFILSPLAARTVEALSREIDDVVRTTPITRKQILERMRAELLGSFLDIRDQDGKINICPATVDTLGGKHQGEFNVGS